MTGRTTSIRVDGIPGVHAMLNQYDARTLGNTLRRAVRAGAQPMRRAISQTVADEPHGPLPNDFAKVPAPKVSTRGGASGREIVARVRPTSPLFVVFETGAESHDISGGLMSGAAGDRYRRAPFAARGRVRHPGMRARPTLPTAYARGRNEALAEAARVLFGR